MLYAKDQKIKDKIVSDISIRGEKVTPENLMREAKANNISFGFFSHKEDDSVSLILNDNLIYLDPEAEITKTEGSYKKYEDSMSGVTELENKMQKDIDTIMNGGVDLLCGDCDN